LKYTAHFLFHILFKPDPDLKFPVMDPLLSIWPCQWPQTRPVSSEGH